MDDEQLCDKPKSARHMSQDDEHLWDKPRGAGVMKHGKNVIRKAHWTAYRAMHNCKTVLRITLSERCMAIC